ncbi:hypothetical protein BKA69DRAFT_1105695 [Paraphysoderma sedebokerense]|nr:hypothetical protein BKA69DRAFT_1105695 [Paraphysoderma sedebokerense]
MKLQWKSRPAFGAIAITTFLYFWTIYSNILRTSDLFTPQDEALPTVVNGNIRNPHTLSQKILHSPKPQLSLDSSDSHIEVPTAASPARTGAISNLINTMDHSSTLSQTAVFPSTPISTSSPLVTPEPKLCDEPSLPTKMLLDVSKRPVNEETLPKWIGDLCPEVAIHFSRFPYFANFTDLPVMTTSYAAHSVCAMKIASAIAAAVEAKIYLHAGSHLGAILHGGPIPWDDDVDMFLPYDKKEEFLSRCSKLTNLHLQISLECVVGFNSVKFSIVSADSVKGEKPWKSPFVDVFLFQIHNGTIYEVDPNGVNLEQSYSLHDYFPTRPFYFGGVQLDGPRELISLRRYNTSICKTGGWNHRLENWPSYNGSHLVDCCHLSNRFPFIYNHSFIFDGRTSHPLTDLRAFDYSFARETWYIPDSLKNDWIKMDKIDGDYLPRLLPNASTVEIDNSLSKCQNRNSITVVEFNAGHGRMWRQSVDIFKKFNADVIILNDMDIGMARSDQQHTTRLLAFSLGMNYAWGLEFFELTRGDRHEQNLTAGMTNFLGLRGNAILSKCEIMNPVIFRNNIEVYADDFEKHFGSRMGLLSQISVGSHVLTVGSIQRLDGFKNEIKNYIGSTKAVIAGNQAWDFCAGVGLAHVDEELHFTYPASCKGNGSWRSDIICSNANIIKEESTIRPCIEQHGNEIRLSDHSLTSVVISIV